MPIYSKRNLFALEPHYGHHINAMLSMKLESPVDIAAELAVRDLRLSRAISTIVQLQLKISRAAYPETDVLIDNLLDDVMGDDVGHKNFIKVLMKDITT